MNRITQYLLFSLLLMGTIGCSYFLSQILHIPFFVLVGLFIGGTTYIIKQVRKIPYNHFTPDRKYSKLVIIAFIYLLYLFADHVSTLATKHGDWDAMAIWNLHAKYLTSPHHWQNIFTNIETEHPDYPICYPSIIAFLLRLLNGNFALIIPFFISASVTLLAPALIMSDLLKKNTLIALGAMWLFCSDMFYLQRGVSQYADTLLAVFFLGAVISIHYTKVDKRYLTACSASLFLCACTKNEGVLLLSVFTLFYAKVFFNKENIKYLFAGAAIPAATWLIFKVICPVSNDMVHFVGSIPYKSIFNNQRISKISQFFTDNTENKFGYIKVLLTAYLLLCIVEKKWPDKQIFMLTACLFLYLAIYLFSYHDLQWHLSTSLDRLMHQLMPATIYVIARRLSNINISLSEQSTTESVV